MSKPQTIGGYVIKDPEKETYLKHDDTTLDHPYEDVINVEDATVWNTLEHASYALWWYVDMYKYYEIIDLDTGDTFVKEKFQRVVKV
ncbi:hypothetical protein [Paenibacillus sp. FSL L8-0708]|uniref:hypothetical protein n=1 Tax=Paenibacillus sp. FSL L8-0708 TaxID=2975311 RepID=UPI0030F5FA67